MRNFTTCVTYAVKKLVSKKFANKSKSESALTSPDKHKTNHTGGVSLWSDLAYDLEGLGAAAGQ
ncbi:hypothetical protein GCM10009865_23880 [Aeromicrobium ponti]